MKPIIFPFTFVSRYQLACIGTFFDRALVYQAAAINVPDSVSQGADDGLLEIITPVTGDEAKLEQLLAEYRTWLDLHKGSEMTFFKSRLFDSFDLESVPYFSKDSTSRIKRDIKDPGGRAEKEPKQEIDPLFAARFFLWVAQAFDIQHHDINDDLAQFKELEKQLYTEMLGDEDFSETSEAGMGKSDEVILEDVGQYKTVQRLSAWLKLFEQDPITPGESGQVLFLTPSRAVLEHVLEIAGETEKVIQLGPVAVGDTLKTGGGDLKKALADYLDTCSAGLSDKEPPRMKTISSAQAGACLEIYAIEGKSPWDLFRAAGAKSGYRLQGDKTGDFSRTLVGFTG